LFALVVAPVVMAPWLAAALPGWQRYVTRFTGPAIAINGVAITLVAASNTQAENAFPYEVLAGVLLYAYFLGGLLFRVALPLAAGITLFYLAVDTAAGLDAVTLADHAFALATVVVLGGIARWMGERAERRAWLQAQVLKQQALRDALTGLANRHRAYDHVAAALAQARRDGRSVGLLLIDVDYFKRYNDALGHPAGDECLRCIAMVLTGIAHRPLDLEMRLGGEEFAVFLYDCTQAHAEQIAEDIRATIEGMGLPHPGSPVGLVTVSIGVAAGQPGADDRLDTLIQRADPALYQAKQSGRNLVRVKPFPELASATA
jgi:diguanylate cyclase (GGDEF)-like protein